MVKWLDRLVEHLRREKTVAPSSRSPPEQELVVYSYEPIKREGVYRFCWQTDFTRRISGMSQNVSFGTAHYVALLDTALDGSLGIIVEHHFRPDYRRTRQSCMFVDKPLSVLTPYDVYDAFWRNLRQPILPGLPDTTPVFSDDIKPVLYREAASSFSRMRQCRNDCTNFVFVDSFRSCVVG